MAHADHLISVIQSLSKSERRYFKMHGALQEGSKAYMGLFELLDSMRHDEENIKKTFEKKYSGSDYAASRKHLYKILMRSLRNYETDKTPEDQLISIVANVKILLNKGLLEAGFAEIARGKKIAWKYDKYFYYLILARMELQHLTLAGFPHVNESTLLDKQEKINSLLYQELYINKHSALYELLLHRYVHQGAMRSDGEREKLNDLLLEEFQVNASQRHHNFQTDKLHLHFQSAYFLMTGDAQQGLLEFYKLNTLFEQHRAHWKDEPLYYIYLINGIVSNLRSAGEYNEMKVFIQRLENIEVNTAGIQRLVQHLIYQHSLALLIDEGNFEQGLNLFRQFDETGSLVAKVPLHVLATTRLNTAILFFGNRNFKNALHYVNDVLAIPEPYLSRHIYVVARLLFLIVHLELSNEDVLTYAIKSLERKLKSIKVLYQTEKITIDFLKKRIAASGKLSPEKANQQYADQLASISHDKYESQVLKTFNLVAWIQSRINKVSFADQTKQQFKRT